MVATAGRKKERNLKEFGEKLNNSFRVMILIRKDGKDCEGGDARGNNMEG